MASIDTNLLNKIQAIKSLRDRAGTEGEKDAAQHKLTLLLAKYSLTEQDIPDPSFSTRGRSHTHPSHSPHSTQRFRRETEQRRKAERAAHADFNKAFEETLRYFREVVKAKERQQRSAARNPNQRSKNRNPNTSTFPSFRVNTSRKVTWTGHLLYQMGKALGQEVWRESVDDTSGPSYRWNIRGLRAEEIMQVHETLVIDLKRYCRQHIRTLAPSNPNAFRRAFYEAAILEISARLEGHLIYPYVRYKSKETQGLAAGEEIGRIISLAPLTAN